MWRLFIGQVAAINCQYLSYSLAECYVVVDVVHYHIIAFGVMLEKELKPIVVGKLSTETTSHTPCA